ncbi:MAG: hypothetical protein JXQ29_13575 [Planctomycetes bacterium]|nr:hypothetical protein [Planctomycetota bacterium]
MRFPRLAGGRHWRDYFPRVSSELLAAQQPDASWPSDIGPGPVFGPAAACIILQIPLYYRPILQR